MRALLTGGGGFIGSHFAEYLLAETGYDVHIVDDFSTGVPGNVAGLREDDRVDVDELDVRDEAAMREAVASADEVYHFAAAVGVEKVVNEPLLSLKTNVEGTQNVLDPAAEDGTPVFVASSSEVYGKSLDVPFDEDDDRVLGPTTVPRWGYANAKALDEFLGLAHHQENGLPVVVGRFFNIVGPRQVGDYGMVIPTFVEQALRGDPITVYGDGTQTRSFTHVQDACEVVFDLMQTDAATGDVFNVGSSEPVTINELADRVKAAAGSDSPVEHVPFDEVYGDDFEEPPRRYPATEKLESALGYAPDTDLETILADVVEEQKTKLEV
ncbi:NAD-dependent epimerase/dehydratase family protein [Halorubellus litoreus]|uniref:UDP-glucuronate decarboxylase n=1 Tax=Halorubellus litoreus TaxID=755308 RepID=A0ABD5VFW0_9EURY